MKLTDAETKLVQWMKDHGGDAAVARTRNGGRYILAQGETAPFMMSTARSLVVKGLAEYVDQDRRKSARFRLTNRGLFV